jgi:hypothetical protein
VPKEIKGTKRRTPPEPAPHSVVDEWLDGVMPSLQPVVRALDQTICAAIADLGYGVKYRRAFYGVPGRGWVVEIAAYMVSANVLFLGGADFGDPPPLGDVNRTRFVKIRTVDEARQPDLLRWLDQARRVPGWT